MSPTYKLTYFDSTGLGEPLRYMFAISGLKYEDVRLAPKTKPDTKFGKVPILEVDGKVLHQSVAIGRYLAKKTGLAGKSDWAAAQADAIVDTLVDMRQMYRPYFYASDETKKAEIWNELKNVHTPFYLSKFEKIVEENGGYFIQNQLTWADVFFAYTINKLISTTKEVNAIDAYPNLKSLHEKVCNLPGLKEHLAAQAGKE